jgi:bifunctional UDP-N-acetylglucosamine pyrophosphorylase/glucosamine-1-phosphate N-acetyltransferase
MKTTRSAIVLAAGKGTRMKSGLAKVLHRANGRPLAYYPVRRAVELGCSPIVVVVGHQGDRVRDELTALFPDAGLKFAVQKEQKGTADAVLSARRALAGREGRVLILYGDVPLLTGDTLARLLARGGKAPVSFLTMCPPDPTGYGRVARDPAGRVRAIVEHKDATPAERELRECNAGIYDCDAAFLWKALRGVGARNAQRELYLTDMVAAAHAAGTPAVAVEAPPEEVAGVNDKVELAAAARTLRLRVVEAHQKAGAIVEDPATAFIEDGVELGADAVIEPNVTLRGRTRIATGARIGAGSVVDASEVGEDAVVKPYSVLEEARVGARAIVGPFARLRPGTELAPEVHIGNFVETKKTKMGRGSKANHLAYLGDATVGARCNVGAGTITCNYDGVNKLPTVLGDDVFIGSDTQLVAPVTVGEGAYVGAGATITRDVPPGALALSRAPQTVKEGWATARRAAIARARAEGKKGVKARVAARRGSR